ncbi:MULTISPECIES: hypothetical protein [Acinetobacter]|uniref:Uncharacterized protein n=1 Tax=Acinetobacter ursingii TaxID=108980 RepID=A0AA46NC30_9GAMM|nr:hypothetical protein [Acinetobacter ursingii]UYF71867.1 hypothetical protein LSO60_00765 [Acinetobacter ursingii]
MEEITFRNVGYQTRLIELPILGNVLISTTALNEALMTGDGGYVSIEASQIDEKIYYFVEDVEIKLPDSELSNLILKQII